MCISHISQCGRHAVTYVWQHRNAASLAAAEKVIFMADFVHAGKLLVPAGSTPDAGRARNQGGHQGGQAAPLLQRMLDL